MSALGPEEILAILPHRYPFLLVDRIQEIVRNEYAVGIKNVTLNEPFFRGHFPHYPVMPGVLVIPGDQLRMRLEIIRQHGPLWHVRGRAFVEKTLAAEAELHVFLADTPREGHKR